MDIANFVLTFGPASLVVCSIGSRLIKSYRASRMVKVENTPTRTRRTCPRPPISIMSRTKRMPLKAPAQGSVAATPATALPVIAMPGNEGNDVLPGNAVAQAIPPGARDIIRMQAKAEAVVALLESKTMTNKAEAIELIFTCKRSGRPQSVYQQALVLVDSLLTRYPQRTAEQEANRRELELSPAA